MFEKSPNLVSRENEWAVWKPAAGEHPQRRHFMTRVFELCIAGEYADDVEAVAALTGRRRPSSPVHSGLGPYERFSAFRRELHEVAQVSFLDSQLKAGRATQCQVLIKEGRHHGDTPGHGRARALRTLKSTFA